MAVARNSLDAQLTHWQDGRTITAKEWIAELYEQIYLIVKQQGYSCFLSPIQNILRSGNIAQQWLQEYRRGIDIPTIIEQAITEMVQQEKDLESKLCQPILVA
jgi:predicted glutamate--cysteine ligase